MLMAKFTLTACLSSATLHLSHTVRLFFRWCFFLAQCFLGKAHFLASNMPTEMVLRGLSSSDSNGTSQSLIFHSDFWFAPRLKPNVQPHLTIFAQWHAWLHQLPLLRCTAIKSFLHSGAAARSTANSLSVLLHLGSNVRAQLPCSCWHKVRLIVARDAQAKSVRLYFNVWLSVK